MIDLGRGMRRVARELLPPIVARGLRRVRRTAPGALFEGDYPPFEEALAATRSRGYREPDIVQTTLQVTADYRARMSGSPGLLPDARTAASLMALLLALDTRRMSQLDVLDFGGGVGLHHFAMAPF